MINPKNLASIVDEEKSEEVTLDHAEQVMLEMQRVASRQYSQARRNYRSFKEAIHNPGVEVRCYRDQETKLIYYKLTPRQHPLQEFINRTTGVTKE